MTHLDILQHNMRICALGDHLRIKAHQPDALAFVRLGDFYETFNEDAATVSKALDIVLTSIPNGRARAPMTGVPAAVAENYFARLVAQGHKLAVLEPDAAPRLLLPAAVAATTGATRAGAPAQPPATPWPASAAVQLSLFAE